MPESEFQRTPNRVQSFSLWWRWYEAYWVLIKATSGRQFNDLDYYKWNNGSWGHTSDPRVYTKWAEHLIRFLSRVETRPWIILNGPVDALRYIKLDQEKFQKIKNQPIALFIYEHISFLNDITLDSWVPENDDSSNFISVELDSILEFNSNHGGQLDMTVYVCDHKLSRRLKSHPRYSSLKVKTFDIFLIEVLLRFEENPFLVQPNLNCAKTGICLNYRYEPIREMVVAYLRAKDYHRRSYLSFYHTHEPEMYQRVAFDLKNWSLKSALDSGLKKMQSELPYSLEAKMVRAVRPSESPIPNMKPTSNIRVEKRISSFYDESHVAIVNETRFFSYFPNLSEKTLNAIFYGKPFVLIGVSGCLEYLRELGFETFSEFWDESYDSERDYQKRIEKIFKTIDFIYSLSPKQLSELTWAMYPKLYRNRINLKALLGTQKRFLESEH